MEYNSITAEDFAFDLGDKWSKEELSLFINRNIIRF